MDNMQNIKDDIRSKILMAGRELVRHKGTDFLTARKLSEASNCSIGMIYNQFANMDDFAAEQNEITLRELYGKLSAEVYGNDSYHNLMVMVDIFTSFINDNRELWFLLYNFHLNGKGKIVDIAYKRQLAAVLNVGARDFCRLFPNLGVRRRKIMREVLLLSLFSLSSVLAASMLDSVKKTNRDNLCRIFANTFLAGVALLEKE